MRGRGGRTNRWMALFVPLLAAGALLLQPAATWAQEQWDREKGDCDKVLKDTKLATRNIKHLTECSDLFLSYRDTTKLTPQERRDYRRGFSVLYYKGEDAGRENADDILKRLGTKALDRELVFPDESAGEAALASCKNVPDSDAASVKKAQASNKQGLAQYKAKKYRKAVEFFEKAMKEDPAWLEPIYNAACNYALLKDSRASVELLNEIKSRCGREPKVYLTKAHTDKDFKFIKKDPNWRRATGYVEILLLNGAGPEGEQDVDRIARDLTTTMGRKPAFTGTDKYPRSAPIVYYKEPFKGLAEQIKDIVGSPRTRMKPINFNTAIKDYNFDIYVVWGMPHRAKLKEIPKIGPAGGGGGGTDAAGNPLDAFSEGLGKVKDARGAVDDGTSTVKGATEAPKF